MKAGDGFTIYDLRFTGALALAAFAGAGCGEKTSSSEPVGEIRGTPIAQKVERASTNGPAAAATPAKATVLAAPGYAVANFDTLSGYPFEVTDELLGPITNDLAATAAKTDAMIPAPVRALNDKPVSVKGFMLPLKVENGLVTELLIMKDQSMCCYGSTPKINEWVSVKMKSRGVRALMDQPVTLFGTLRVGESRENGYLVGIYRLDGERMEAPEE